MGNINLYKSKLISPIGELWFLSDGESLKEISFENREDFKNYEENDKIKIFSDTKFLLSKYFAEEKVDFSKLKLSFNVSPFRKTVWEILKTIPYGETMTYGEIAKIVGQKFGKEKISAQAVGGAVGANLFPIIIPCHRVVGKDRNLTGYSGGLEKKMKLLEIEGHKLDSFKFPKNYKN